MKHFRFSLENNWYVYLISAISTGIAATLLLFKLGSLTGGISANEYTIWQRTFVDGLSLIDLLRDASYLPYKFLLWIVQYLPFHGNGALRLPGVLFGLIGVIGIFSLLKQWYTIRVAYFGTALFLCSNWLLHTTRFASPLSVYAATPILLAMWTWVISDRHRHLGLLLFTVSGAMAFYVPGAVWLLIPALFWQYRNIVQAFRNVSIVFSILTVILGVTLLVPFVLTIALPLQGTSWEALQTFLALPGSIPSMSDIATNLLNIPKELFITSQGDPTRHLGHLPLLDAFATAMFVVG
jgi:hypothetical protein